MVSKTNILILLYIFFTITHSVPEFCAELGDVRIVDRRKLPQVCDQTREGQLTWLYICKDAWDANEADILCKQLGFIRSDSTVQSYKKKGNNEEKVSDLMCNSSTHKRLVDCPHTHATGKCDYVANLECERCSSSDQCNGEGVCEPRTGQCSCNSACDAGNVCIVGSCECIKGMQGATCEEACQSSCLNGGVCNSSLICDCPPLFHGDVCQYKSCKVSCRNNGTCLSNGRCKCLDMYNGEGCEFKSCSVSCPIGSLCDRNGTCTTTGGTATHHTEEINRNTASQVPELSINTQIVIYSSIAATVSCLVLSCATALVIAISAWRMCLKSKVARKDEVYEDMASLHSSTHSSNSIEYNSNVWPCRITPYLVVGDGTAPDRDSIPYYATVESSSANDYEYVDVAPSEYPAYVNTREDIHIPYLIN